MPVELLCSFERRVDGVADEDDFDGRRKVIQLLGACLVGSCQSFKWVTIEFLSRC